MIDDSRRERTLWRCRRGILELDLFFQQFVEQHYPLLTEREHAALERLLETPDPVLLDYCYGVARPGDPELQALVQKIVG
jgi:antitoxin CptB